MRSSFLRRALVFSVILTIPLAALLTGGPDSSDVPQDARTGAPGEYSCTQCHGSAQGDGALVVSAPAQHEAGQTYSITVSLEDPGQSRWGFELTAIDEAGDGAGSFTVTNPAVTQLSDNAAPARDYMMHTSNGTFPGVPDGPVTWTFDWTAPATADQNITFYAAGNAANNNGTTSGDFIYTVAVTTTPFQPCEWQPGDPHKMHFPQLPDTVGWDVNATDPMVLADDWRCSESGWIKDLHFWGSWKDDVVGEIQFFALSIHSNIPEGGGYGNCFADGDINGDGTTLTIGDLAYLINHVFMGGPGPVPWYSGDLNGDCVVDARDLVVFQNYIIYGLPAFDPYGGYPVPTCCDSITYSRPGQILWERQISDYQVVAFDPTTWEGWFDPSIADALEQNHQGYFQYNICLDSLDWFWQGQDTVYWLNISAIVAEPQTTQWGWKSSYHHFMDDAVWAYAGDLQWSKMYEPSPPRINHFWVAINENGVLLPELSGGTDFYGEGWYEYPQTDWWNIWFYDHPFTYVRDKYLRVEFDVFPYNPQEPTLLTFAVNWSTDIWSLEGQPPGDSMPPLPGSEPESLYIGRDIYYDGEPGLTHFTFEWRWPDYNPEWVSIDVRGSNFVIPEGSGMVMHRCRQSLDLAFVVTAGEVCDCSPGNVDGNGILNVSDAVYLITYIFGGGPPPQPYPLCSCDANCDCLCNVSDVVYVIAFIFAGGTPACSCEDWLDICGPPLR